MQAPSGLTRNMFRQYTGLNPSFYNMVYPGGSWKARLRRWLWRRMFRLLRALSRRGWARRRILAPGIVAIAAYVVAAVAHLVPAGWESVLAIAVLGAVPLYRRLGGPLGRWTKRRGLKPVDQRIWYGVAYVVLVAWTAVAAAWRLGPPMPGVWLTLLVPVWVRWLWHHRTRSAPAVQAIAVAGRQKTWSEIKSLAGTHLVNIADLTGPRRWEADVDLSDTDLLVANVVTAVPFISKKFRTPQMNVIADYAPGRLEHVARLTVVEENPCELPAVYDESWMPTDADIAEGVVPFHLFPNGTRGKARLWHPRAGTVNSLFSGDIGSGKSAGMEAKAIQAMWTGKVWVMAGDPQGGASLPALCGADGQARWAAVGRDDDLDEIYNQLCFLREGLYVRSDEMKRLEWTDKFGDTVTGLASWDPDITGWPAIGYTLDEVWRLMLIPEFAVIIKELLKMQRKVGFWTDMATQYPSIEEFNNDMGMRQCITSGNMFSYANSAGTTVKAMILPSHLPSPDKIPSETLAGDHTKGMLIAASKAPRSSLPVYSRSVWAERNIYWARQAAQRMPDLEPALEKVRAKYQTPVGSKDAEPVRESVTVAVREKRTTHLDRIMEFLETRPGHRCRSGVIAHALDLPLSRVSGALGRGSKKGLVHKHNGVWSLGPAVGQAAAA